MTQQRKRIWIDQDSTIYDLSTPWYALHNKDYPQHNLRVEHVDGWDTAQVCRDNNCPADIYSYFNDPKVWRDGKVIDGAYDVIKGWHDDGIAELGVITTAANSMSMPYKIEWLEKNFPFIKNIFVVYKAHLKHLVDGDFLIDDKIDNLTEWRNVAILYTQPWNVLDNKLLRARGNTDLQKWKNIDLMVRSGMMLLSESYNHQQVIGALRRAYNKKEE